MLDTIGLATGGCNMYSHTKANNLAAFAFVQFTENASAWLLLVPVWLFYGIPVEFCKVQSLQSVLRSPANELSKIKTSGWTGGPLAMFKQQYIAITHFGVTSRVDL